jgi:hypothetical protein
MSSSLPIQPRRVSGLERAWLVADRLRPPFVNQLVLEGEGGLSQGAVERAVQQTAAVMPGLSVRARGWLRGAQWVPGGPPPPVRVEDGAAWDGRSPDGAPFLVQPLDPVDGPIAEVVLLEGSPDGLTRLVIRTHHAALDGRGAQHLAEGLFAALRGQDPEPVGSGPDTDADVAALAGVPSRKDPPPDRGSPTGASTSDAFEVTWLRRRVEGRFRGLLSQAIVALWSASQPFATEPLRVGVPVDLRRYRPGLRSTANLTGILHVDLGGVTDLAAAQARARSRLAHGLDAHAAAAHALGLSGLRNLPLWFVTWAARRQALEGLQTGRFSTSATVSNLGRQDLDLYRGGGFEARRAFWIPPGQPGLPLFLALSGDDFGVELCGSMPVGLASGGRLAALLDGVADALVQARPKGQA